MSDRIKIVCMDCACKRTIALHKWSEAERYSRYYPNIRYAKCNLLPEVQELQGAGDGGALQRVPDGVCAGGDGEASEV